MRVAFSGIEATPPHSIVMPAPSEVEQPEIMPRTGCLFLARMRRANRADEGQRMAMREVVKWIIKREAWLEKHAPKAPRPITRLSSPDPDNADAALMLLGIAAPNPARADIGADRAQLLLEPWAVQAALRRRRGGNRLTDRERNEIRRCTRDRDCLRWPRGTGE